MHSVVLTGWTFSRSLEQFWHYAIPDATTDSPRWRHLQQVLVMGALVFCIVIVRCLCSDNTTILLVPSTHQTTLGNCIFLVAATQAWNSLSPETRSCSSLLTFRRETMSHLFRQSYGWLGAAYSDRQQTSALSCTTVLAYELCEVLWSAPGTSVMVAL